MIVSRDLQDQLGAIARGEEQRDGGRMSRIYIGPACDVPPGTPVFDPAAEFAAFEFRLRAPAPSTDGLLRVQAEGDCLAPHLLDGDVHYFDPALPPEDGDFVLTFWPPHELAAAYSRPVLPLLTKWYRVVEGYPLLLCHDGARPLRDQLVLGVLRRVERNGEVVR